MLHSTSDNETIIVSRYVVKLGADAKTTILYTFDKKTAPRAIKLNHCVPSEVGRKTHEHIFGPTYVKGTTADGAVRAPGITNPDPRSPHSYPENGTSVHSVSRAHDVEKDPSEITEKL